MEKPSRSDQRFSEAFRFGIGLRHAHFLNEGRGDAAGRLRLQAFCFLLVDITLDLHVTLNTGAEVLRAVAAASQRAVRDNSCDHLAQNLQVAAPGQFEAACLHVSGGLGEAVRLGVIGANTQVRRTSAPMNQGLQTAADKFDADFLQALRADLQTAIAGAKLKLATNYDPAEARDDHGRWTNGNRHIRPVVPWEEFDKDGNKTGERSLEGLSRHEQDVYKAAHVGHLDELGDYADAFGAEADHVRKQAEFIYDFQRSDPYTWHDDKEGQRYGSIKEALRRNDHDEILELAGLGEKVPHSGNLSQPERGDFEDGAKGDEEFRTEHASYVKQLAETNEARKEAVENARPALKEEARKLQAKASADAKAAKDALAQYVARAKEEWKPVAARYKGVLSRDDFEDLHSLSDMGTEKLASNAWDPAKHPRGKGGKFVKAAAPTDPMDLGKVTGRAVQVFNDDLKKAGVDDPNLTSEEVMDNLRARLRVKKPVQLASKLSAPTVGGTPNEQAKAEAHVQEMLDILPPKVARDLPPVRIEIYDDPMGGSGQYDTDHQVNHQHLSYNGTKWVNGALSGSDVAAGTVGIAYGGTGTATAPTAGQILIGQTAGTYIPATITAGAGITITNTSGAISIAASGSATLAGLSDVSITSPANNNVLQYQASSSKWINSASVSGGLTDPTTTVGDLIVRNSTTPTRLGVGADTYVLTADSTQATGMKWAAASSAGMVAAPSTATSSGAAGSLAYDGRNLYVCTATNTWKILPYASGFPANYTYASDGDANGVFYHAGVIAGGGTWTNPVTASAVTLSFSGGIASGSYANIVNRATSDNYATNSQYESLIMNLQSGHSLILTEYSYRARSGTGSFPTAWVLEGSNDQASWTTIDTQTGLSFTSNQWKSVAVSGQTKAYQFFRLRMTAADSSAAYYLTIGQFELYGNYQ